MKHYFIDYENVHDSGLTGIDKIDKDSVIYLLYSDACKNVSIAFLEKVLNKEIRVKLYKTETGKNALDFQLSSVLGYIIKQNEKQESRKGIFKKQTVSEHPVKQEYFIISKDQGFDAIVEFWKQRNVNISRVHNLAGDVTVTVQEKKVQTPNKKKEVITKEPVKLVKKEEPKPVKKKAAAAIPQATKEELLKYLTPGEYSDEILKVVNSYKTRMAINNGFTHIFKDTGKAGVIYNKLKPLLKEKGRK